MDPNDTTNPVEVFPDHTHHAQKETQTLWQYLVQERDDLREYATRLEQQLAAKLDESGKNAVDLIISDRDACLKRLKILEKIAAKVAEEDPYEIQRLEEEIAQKDEQYDKLYQQAFGHNGYKDRLQSTQVALELANTTTLSPEAAELTAQLAVVTKERDEANLELARCRVPTSDLHRNLLASLDHNKELEKQNMEANQEIERLRRANEQEDSYRMEQVQRLQEEKIEWDQERMKLEGRNAELSLRLRTLEDMLAASEARKSSTDVQMPDVSGDEGAPSPLPEVLGDAVWRRWSDILWNHIQAQPQEVEDIYNLAKANLYRPGGAFPDSDLGVETPRHEFPGVTWVKELVKLGCSRPIAPTVEEADWKKWANQLQDFVLPVPNEIDVLYRLGQEGQLMTGVQWIHNLISIASDQPTSPERPATLKEYQLGVELKEAQATIEELRKVCDARIEDEDSVDYLRVSSRVLEQALETERQSLETERLKNDELKQEMEISTARFEDEIEQLIRDLKASHQQQDILRKLCESGNAHKEAKDEIEHLKKDLQHSYDRGNEFKELYQNCKQLSDEHEYVWQQKFDKEVAKADKHAAGLVEEAETLQGRLNGAYGVITEMEKVIDKLREQIADKDRGSGESATASGLGAVEDGQSTPEDHESEKEESEETEEEEEESEELKTVKTDLYNTLEEVEELRLKLGFADRAFNDMKEEFESKIAQIENNAKEEMAEKERMAEKLRLAEDRFNRGVAAEVRRLERQRERERQLEFISLGTQTDQPEADIGVTVKGKGKGRKAAPAAPKPKKPVARPEIHEESPPLTALDSPLESPDVLMKGDKEYRGPGFGKKAKAKDKKVQGGESSDAGSEGAMGTRRSTRSTRNTRPVYKEVPLKVLLGSKKSPGAGRKRKFEEVAEGSAGVEEVEGDEASERGEREKVKRRGSKMI
ncbi:hypothetical protein NHQ30_010064 [Ciborinia camelliae]|nr:hypothetical protein NHQ30_010064 [Ciborinia camelliae]